MLQNPPIAYKYVTEDRLIKFIEHPSIRFTPPSALNDPFEYRPKIVDEKSSFNEIELNDDVVGIMNAFLAQMSAHLGTCALSTDPKSTLMWSHYADAHRGAVIGFNLDDEFFRSFKLFEVTYAERKPEIRIEELKSSGFRLDNPVSLDWVALTSDRPELIKTKSAAWAYESEVRLVKYFDRIGLDKAQRMSFAMGSTRRTRSLELDMTQQIEDVPPGAVVSVTLGAKHQVAFSNEGIELLGDTNIGLEERVRARIENNQQLGHIKVLRAHADPNTYERRDGQYLANEWTAS